MNRTLLLGLIISTIMIVVALFGPLFAPYELTDQVVFKYTVGENGGKGSVISPPIAPGAMYPFGTDKNGYDLMTKLLYGAKYTILFSIGVAASRVFIGGLSGMLLGYYGGNQIKRRKDKESYWSMLNGIPIFLIVWLTMSGISINPIATPFMMATILSSILILVGIPSVASTIRDKTMILREKQYVMSAHSLGAGGWKIIRSHIFPYLKESLTILFVQEIILTLTIFGQLAIFNIFVGGTTMYPDPTEYYSRTNEWSGLIGTARFNFYIYEWIFFIPLALYILAIVGFHWVSRGLEKHYHELYTKYSQL